MASDVKISQMPSATSLEGTELIPIVQGRTNKTTTPSKIKEGLATVAQLNNKVDKDGSKVLSEQNFTTTLKNKLDGIADNANNYVHPTTAGNKHIPAGGSSGQILKWSAAGTATWGAEKTYSEATSSAAGLMSAADKAKLDGIAAQANKYVLPAAGTSIGGVKQGTAVEDATSADDVITVVNALLASLRTSGAIATSSPAAAMYNTIIEQPTSEDIIDFNPPMIIEKGKLYKEDTIVYECIQTSKLPISNKLKDLVGYYVKIIK